MAATVQIHEWNTEASITDKTSGTVRFKNANDATADLNDPLIIPTSGQEYSFEKWLRLVITDEGGFTQISNLQVYTDGANGFGTGVLAWYAITGVFITPVVPLETDDPPQTPAAGSPKEDMADLFGLTTGARGDMDAINTGPFTGGSPQEYIGDWIVIVMEVNSTATQGVTPSETITFSYDEI